MKKIDFYLVVLAILFSLFLNKQVNQFVNFIVPSTKINLKILDTNKEGIMLLETDKKVKLSDIKTDNEVKFIQEGENGYSLNALWIQNNNKEIEIEVKKLPNLKLSFYNIAAQKIEITSDKYTQIIDLEEKAQGEIVDYFPFASSKLFLIYSIVNYILLSFLIYIGIIVVFVKKKVKIKKMKFLNNYNPLKMFFIIYILILLYVSYKFLSNTLPRTLNINEINENLFIDQEYYWKLGSYLLKGQYEELLKRSYTFRGYVTFAIPAIAQMIGTYLRVNSHWIFTMINNFFISILLAYILPEIYNQLSNKKAKNYHILTLFLIFSFFWKGVYYSGLFDILGAVFLLWMILKILKWKNKKDIFLAGIFGGIAALGRGNYVWTIVILFLVKILYDLIKTKKIFLLNIFLFWAGIILICLPQIKINYDLGHIGLFPFDKIGSYKPAPDEKLIVYLINESMRNFFLTYPMGLGDRTSQQILINFSQGARLNMNQILSAFIYSPIETIIVIVKKIFLALDTRTNEVYPKKLWELTFYSLVNYFIIATSLFFTKNKLFTKKEKLLGISLFVSAILPQTIMTVEWRYYIVLYLMVYYIFVFKFVSLVEQKEKFSELKKEGYFKFISFAIVMFFVISSYYLH
jgi:membrane protein